MKVSIEGGLMQARRANTPEIYRVLSTEHSLARSRSFKIQLEAEALDLFQNHLLGDARIFVFKRHEVDAFGKWR